MTKIFTQKQKQLNEHPRRKRTGYHLARLTHFAVRPRSIAPFGRYISQRRKRRRIQPEEINLFIVFFT